MRPNDTAPFDLLIHECARTFGWTKGQLRSFGWRTILIANSCGWLISLYISLVRNDHMKSAFNLFGGIVLFMALTRVTRKDRMEDDVAEREHRSSTADAKHPWLLSLGMILFCMFTVGSFYDFPPRESGEALHALRLFLWETIAFSQLYLARLCLTPPLPAPT